MHQSDPRVRPMTRKDALPALYTFLIFVTAAYLSIEEEKQWDKFKADHNCLISTTQRANYLMPAPFPPSSSVGDPCPAARVTMNAAKPAAPLTPVPGR